jgi:hypothetical protein
MAVLDTRAALHAYTHEPPQPHPVPVLALKGAGSPLGIGRGRFIGAHVRFRRSQLLAVRDAVVPPGESARSRKIAPFGPSPRGGHASFRYAPLRVPTAPAPSWNRVGKVQDARNRHVRHCEGWGWQHLHLLGAEADLSGQPHCEELGQLWCRPKSLRERHDHAQFVEGRRGHRWATAIAAATSKPLRPHRR